MPDSYREVCIQTMYNIHWHLVYKNAQQQEMVKNFLIISKIHLKEKNNIHSWSVGLNTTLNKTLRSHTKNVLFKLKGKVVILFDKPNPNFLIFVTGITLLCVLDQI